MPKNGGAMSRCSNLKSHRGCDLIKQCPLGQGVGGIANNNRIMSPQSLSPNEQIEQIQRRRFSVPGMSRKMI